MEKTKEVVASLRSLLTSDRRSSIEVEILWLPPLTVLTATDLIEHQIILEWCGANFEPLYHQIVESGLVPADPPRGIYGADVLSMSKGEVTIFVPVLGGPDQLKNAGATMLEATNVVVATHKDTYEDLDVTYRQLGTEVNRLGISNPGSIRETYLIGPVNNHKTEHWRTQVCWPAAEPEPSLS